MDSGQAETNYYLVDLVGEAAILGGRSLPAGGRD